jgi:hypothetical protein
MRTSACLGFALALVAAPALAGYRQTAPVRITLNADGSGEFSGSLGDARASSDGVQYIGCAFGSGSGPWGWCYAVDAAGSNAWCLLNSAAQLQALGVIGSSSHLHVYYDRSFNCTSLQVDNFSYSRPATP